MILRKNGILILLVVAAGLVVFLAAQFLSRPTLRPNIILISIDTCRGDYLSCYGFDQPTTPHIDALAEQAVRFEQAIAPVPLTQPSHSSIMTGTIPPFHGVRDNMEYKLADSQITLAEVLADNGYATAGIISAFVLDSQFGLDQGFAEYQDDFEETHTHLEISERPGGEVSRNAEAWLDRNQTEPFFLFLHFFDPHSDYRPPEPYAAKFADDPYAGEIAYTDACIGRVFDKLKAMGLYDSSLIIVLGDHGEGLGQHGEDEHSFFVYQSTLHVPLIIKLPHSQEGKTVDDRVGLIDVMPTVLDAVGLKIPDSVQGQSLTAYFDDVSTAMQERHYYCESFYPTKYGCNPLLGLVSGPWKYIWTTQEELYHLSNDPTEQDNMIEQEPETARRLNNRLRHILSLHAQAESGDKTITLDARTRDRLESLGYVSGQISDDAEIDPQKPDAKPYIDYHRLSRKYRMAMEKGEFEQAEEICAAMGEQYENVVQIDYLRAKVAMEQGRFETALDMFARYAEGRPEDARGHYWTGMMLARLDRHTEAAEAFGKALQLSPDDYMICGNLGLSLTQMGQYDEAIAAFERVLQLHPADADAHANIGVVMALQERFEQAISHYRQAIRLRPGDPSFHDNLAKTLVRVGRIDEAIVHWEKSLELDPGQVRILDRLGQVLYAEGRMDRARRWWKQGLKLRSDHFQMRYNLGMLEYRAGNAKEAVEHWRMALAIDEDQPAALNSLAWVLATSAEEKRNPGRAVELAEKCCRLTQQNNPEYLDTLAVAYASAGNIPKAIQTARKALGLAQQTNQPQLVEKIQRRLAEFGHNQPEPKPPVGKE